MLCFVNQKPKHLSSGQGGRDGEKKRNENLPYCLPAVRFCIHTWSGVTVEAQASPSLLWPLYFSHLLFGCTSPPLPGTGYVCVFPSRLADASFCSMLLGHHVHLSLAPAPQLLVFKPTGPASWILFSHWWQHVTSSQPRRFTSDQAAEDAQLLFTALGAGLLYTEAIWKQNSSGFNP